MSDFKAILEEHSCKPNHGCGVATTCMCSLAEDMADRIEQLEAQVARLRTAIDDVASYVSRADYYYMQPQTIEVMRENRAALEGKDAPT